MTIHISVEKHFYASRRPSSEGSQEKGGEVLAIDQLGTTVTFIFYAVAIVAFALGALGVALHEKVSNLVALGLFAAFFVPFWNSMAAL
ncbi:MAG: hypothetical protein WEE69_05185 [Acidimicrobiia bacterium]